MSTSRRGKRKGRPGEGKTKADIEAALQKKEETQKERGEDYGRRHHTDRGERPRTRAANRREARRLANQN